MEWALWVGAVVVTITIGGMFWMRNQPIRDARGNVVDEYGRPIGTLTGDAYVVLRTLADSTEPQSGYDLRRHVDHLSREEFYAMIANLMHQKFVDTQVVNTHNPGINIRVYNVTERGRAVVKNNLDDVA